MKDSLILEGKIYISAKRAAKLINYAQDYIGQLCRSGKLDCKMIGRSWYVTEESLLNHREAAVDATQERVLKVVKSFTPAPIVKKLEVKNEATSIASVAPVAPVVEVKIEDKKVEVVVNEPVAAIPTPFVFEKPVVPEVPATTFKYESDDRPLLPQITKKLPQQFSLPKKVTDLTTTPYGNKIPMRKVEPKKIQMPSRAVADIRPAAPAPVSAPIISPIKVETKPQTQTQSQTRALATAPNRTLITTGAITLILVTGFVFSIATVNFSASHGVVASIPRSDLVGQISAVPAQTTTSESMLNSNTDFNGIGVAPSSGSENKDALTKQKIQNSFSDEVTVSPDESGKAGVITPVFTKNADNHYVYVLVPVKEKK